MRTRGSIGSTFVFTIPVAIIIEIEKKTNLLQHIWYLDDGILAGTNQQICRALILLTDLGEGGELDRRTEKFELLMSSFDLNAIDNKVKRNSTAVLKILDAAISNFSFLALFLRMLYVYLDR